MVEQLRGKSNISSGVRDIRHKALRLLQHLRQKKASVWITNTPWSKQRCNNAVHRGSHKSAHRDHELVFKKMANFCTQAYCWAVLPYKVVRSWANLRVSPLGAVPQHNRRPRLIVDFSFSEVNAETVQLAPAEAMQFGRALQRVMTRGGPGRATVRSCLSCKYRVWLQIADISKKGVVLPSLLGQQHLIAFILTLPMGWVE